MKSLAVSKIVKGSELSRRTLKITQVLESVKDRRRSRRFQEISKSKTNLEALEEDLEENIEEDLEDLEDFQGHDAALKSGQKSRRIKSTENNNISNLNLIQEEIYRRATDVYD